MISKKLRYILMLLLPGILGFCQTGQEFWFAAPDATSGHNDQPISLNISTYDVAAQVIITQPANPAFTPIGLNLSAHHALIETYVPGESYRDRTTRGNFQLGIITEAPLPVASITAFTNFPV